MPVFYVCAGLLGLLLGMGLLALQLCQGLFLGCTEAGEAGSQVHEVFAGGADFAILLQGRGIVDGFRRFDPVVRIS